MFGPNQGGQEKEEQASSFFLGETRSSTGGQRGWASTSEHLFESGGREKALIQWCEQAAHAWKEKNEKEEKKKGGLGTG